MPAAEKEVCAALEDANDRLTPLEAAWHEADASDGSNAVRKQAMVREVRRQIDELFAKRNTRVMTTISGQHPAVASWVVRLSKIDMTEQDFGHGTKNYVVIKGDLPCSVPTTFTSKEIDGTPDILAAMGKLNGGDYVAVSAEFVRHDEEAQGAAASIAWGGPLWGPFGGLWPDAIRKPAFQLDVSEVHRG